MTNQATVGTTVTIPTETQMLAAVERRDRTYDGVFVSCVVTTGIFCRPSCPARPLPQNIRFLAGPAAARAAGFRACKRCKPEQALETS